MTTLVARSERVRLAGQRHALTAIAHFRLMILLFLFLGMVALLCGRILMLGFMGDGSGHASGAGLVPIRGDIVDRNGVPLARTIDAYSIGVRPDKILGDKSYLAQRLHDIFPDQSASYFYRKLTGGTHWTYLRRRALPEEVAQVNALGEPGIEFPREKERFYPQRTLAAHVLGFTDYSGHGVTGMEQVLDERLTDPKLRGTPVALSIDSRVQAALESELYQGMRDQEARGGAGIVLDVHTGEVLAMASIPVYNPNHLVKGHAEARRNDVTQSDYELGSVMKPLSIAGAIDAGVVTSMSKRYDATGPLHVGRYTIHDDHGLGRWINVPEILIHSSNIGTARIADEMGPERMQAFFRKLGFDKKPQIELRERTSPLWPSNWGRVTNMTVAYGHGMAVTPLHLATAYAALVNGGIWRPATLKKNEDGAVPEGRRIFSAATSMKMRKLLRLIVEDGTGRNADAPGYRAGGKTGSAEKPRAGGYAHHSLVSTFAEAFPMDNPQYVVITMLDEPHGTAVSMGQRTAGWTVAPLAKRLVMRIGPMLGVMPDEHRDIDTSALAPLVQHDGEEEE